MATCGKTVRDITRLPEGLKPPEQRWQKLPTRPRTETTPLQLSSVKTPKNTCTRRSKSAHATPGTAISPKKTPKTSTTTPSSVASCRFIPKRTTNDEYSSHLLLKKDSQTQKDSSESEENDICKDNDVYHNSLLTVSCQGSVPRNVLSFRNVTPGQQESVQRYITSGGIGSAASLSNSLVQRFPGHQEKRKICSDPEKVLDAPNFVDDYYLNLLDWSNKGIVAVALGESIYLWNGDTGEVEQLEDISYERVIITSLSWAEKGRFLAIGLDNGSVQLYDVDKSKKVRTMRGHTDRVGSLHWNNHILASGCRNGTIYLHDVRQQEHLVGQLNHHKLEVCGLKWSLDGCYLASGANDNTVCIWRPQISDKPVQVLSGHQAAVKALAWCPWQPNVIATGGGSNDQTIRFWDTRTGELVQSINTKSPVTSICWSKEHRELITSHGHPKNYLKVWKYPTMSKVAELRGHGERILHMAISPKKTRVISASADETLRIWKCFKKEEGQSAETQEDSIVTMLRNGMF